MESISVPQGEETTGTRPGLRRLQAAQAVGSLGDGAFYVLSAVWLLELGRTPAQVGLVLSAVWGCAALLAPLVGRLADRLGTTRVATGSAVAVSIGLSTLALAPGPVLPLVGMLVYGVGQASWGGLRQTLTADLAPRGRATQARAVLQSLGNAGIALGAAAGGLVLALGSAEAVRVALLADAVLFALVAVVLAGLPTAVPGVAAATGDERIGARLAGLTAAAVLYLYMPLLSVALPLLLAVDGTFPRWTIAAVFVANTVGVVALQPAAAGRVVDLTSARRSVRDGGLALLASCVLLGGAFAVPGVAAWALLVAGIVLQVLGEITFAAGAWDLGYRLAPAGGPARWQSTYGAAVPLARAVGPVVVTTLVVAGPTGWALLGILFGLAGTAMSWLAVADRRAHGSWQRPLAQERCVLSPGSRTSR